MDTHYAPRRRERNLVVQEVGRETLVYDEECHRAFCLGESTSAIWRHCNGARSFTELGEILTKELGCLVNVEAITLEIEELRRSNLLDPIPLVHEISRRTAIQRIGIGSAMLLPGIASIVAPTAAQAYSGCFDCTSTQSTSLQARRARAAAASRNGSGLFSPLGTSTAATPSSSGTAGSTFPSLGGSPNLLP